MPNHQSSAKSAVSLESTARLNSLAPQRKAACHVFLPYHGGHDVGVGGCSSSLRSRMRDLMAPPIRRATGASEAKKRTQTATHPFPVNIPSYQTAALSPLMGRHAPQKDDTGGESRGERACDG